MSDLQKNVLAVHDISCVGRCSLTVALPVLSAAGIETSILPTSLLSTHTGGFDGYTFADLTDEMKKIIAHWSTLGISFDSIYTGYLGSVSQIEIVRALFDEYKESFTFVDPVMGDRGKFYAGFDEEYAKKMRLLCENADCIVPNITEACMLLGEKYAEPPYTEAYIENLLRRLSSLGGKTIILTGVTLDDKTIGPACFETDTDKISYSFLPIVNGYYHGTGDVFASSLLAALMNNIPAPDSSDIATRFTVSSIKRTHTYQSDPRYGVAFEQELHSLISNIEGRNAV